MAQEKTRERDYKREYEKRKQTQRRLRADLDKIKADAFTDHLKAQGTTFAAWLNNQIDNALK